jgi:hypothetical protein
MIFLISSLLRHWRRYLIITIERLADSRHY